MSLFKLRVNSWGVNSMSNSILGKASKMVSNCVVCMAVIAALVAMSPMQKASAQGNGCNTTVGYTASPALNGNGTTGTCFSGDFYRHSSTTTGYALYTIRVYLTSFDSNTCNARAVDSGYVFASSVVRATDYSSVLSCSHPPGYMGTGVHWVDGTQFQSVSST